jgi:glutamine amidotransferase
MSEVNYGMNFTCGVSKGHIYGTQFHPEKSHKFGKKLFENFCSKGIKNVKA